MREGIARTGADLGSGQPRSLVGIGLETGSAERIIASVNLIPRGCFVVCSHAADFSAKTIEAHKEVRRSRRVNLLLLLDGYTIWIVELIVPPSGDGYVTVVKRACCHTRSSWCSHSDP